MWQRIQVLGSFVICKCCWRKKESWHWFYDVLFFVDVASSCVLFYGLRSQMRLDNRNSTWEPWLWLDRALLSPLQWLSYSSKGGWAVVGSPLQFGSGSRKIYSSCSACIENMCQGMSFRVLPYIHMLPFCNEANAQAPPPPPPIAEVPLATCHQSSKNIDCTLDLADWMTRMYTITAN